MFIMIIMLNVHNATMDRGVKLSILRAPVGQSISSRIWLCPSASRVHVRRTDKVGTEAAFHPIEEYMVHVEEHFQLLTRRMQVDKKRVYLATDDPSLLKEAKTK